MSNIEDRPSTGRSAELRDEAQRSALTVHTEDAPTRRVVLSDMSRILSAILRDLVGRQPELVLVGKVAFAELATALPSLQPDVVVLAPPRSEQDRAARAALRAGAPDLTLVEIRPREDRAVVWRPRSLPQRIDLTASGIVQALGAPQPTVFRELPAAPRLAS